VLGSVVLAGGGAETSAGGGHLLVVGENSSAAAAQSFLDFEDSVHSADHEYCVFLPCLCAADSRD